MQPNAKKKITQVGWARDAGRPRPPVLLRGPGSGALIAPRGSQETFDEAVRSNIEDFDMRVSAGARSMPPRRCRDRAPAARRAIAGRAPLPPRARAAPERERELPTTTRARPRPPAARGGALQRHRGVHHAGGGSRAPRARRACSRARPQGPAADCARLLAHPLPGALAQRADLSSIIKTVKGGDTSE
jgi:hypothetical protein